MIQLECLRRRHRVSRFIPRVARRADGVSRDRRAELRGRPTDEARIYAAAEQRADRHIGIETRRDRVEQQPLSLFDRIIERDGRVGVYGGQLPVSACLKMTAGKLDNRAGGNFDYIFIDRARVGDETEVEELGNGALVNLAGKPGVA